MKRKAPGSPRPKRSNRRKFHDCQPSTRARLGWFSARVQDVVLKYRDTIPEATLAEYYAAVALPIVFQTRTVNVEVQTPSHWLAVHDLGLAIADIMATSNDIQAALLRSHLWVDVNGRVPAWKEVPGNFSPAALRQTAKRMRLLGPE